MEPTKRLVTPLSQGIIQSLGGIWSTKHFGIEYAGFLSNHLSHGVIALGRLGATEDRMKLFATEYAARTLESAKQEVNDIEFSEFPGSLLGKRESFTHLASFYEQRIEQNGTEETITKYLPLLSDGVAGAAFHGMIHTGYGYAARVDRLVAEGLAYLHHSNLPLVPKNRQSIVRKRIEQSATAFQNYADAFKAAAEKIRNENNILTDLEEASSLYTEKQTSRFQRRMLALQPSEFVKASSDGDSAKKVVVGGRLNELLNEHIDNLPACNDTSWILDLALDLYVRTCTAESSDFFLLHGVTSSWAMNQMSHLIQDKYKLHRSMEIALLCTYVVQGCPMIQKDLSYLGNSENWEDLVKSATAVNCSDEHVMKLVQVAKEQSLSDDRHLPEEIYREAAARVLNLSFRF